MLSMYAHVKLKGVKGLYPDGSVLVEASTIVAHNGKLQIASTAFEHSNMEVSNIVALAPYCQVEGYEAECSGCRWADGCLRSRFTATEPSI